MPFLDILTVNYDLFVCFRGVFVGLNIFDGIFGLPFLTALSRRNEYALLFHALLEEEVSGFVHERFVELTGLAEFLFLLLGNLVGLAHLAKGID